MMDIISRGMAAQAINQVQILNNYVTTQMVKIDLIKIVSKLPEVGEENKIYLVPKNIGEQSEEDYYDELEEGSLGQVELLDLSKKEKNNAGRSFVRHFADDQCKLPTVWTLQLSCRRSK